MNAYIQKSNYEIEDNYAQFRDVFKSEGMLEDFFNANINIGLKIENNFIEISKDKTAYHIRLFNGKDEEYSGGVSYPLVLKAIEKFEKSSVDPIKEASREKNKYLAMYFKVSSIISWLLILFFIIVFLAKYSPLKKITFILMSFSFIIYFINDLIESLLNKSASSWFGHKANCNNEPTKFWLIIFLNMILNLLFVGILIYVAIKIV